MTLRIYADFNSGGSPGHGPCWLLRYGPQLRDLNEVAEELGLRPGQQVTLFHKDEGEEFEVKAALEMHDSLLRWQALPDWSTFRRIR
jgi:hypothetical protein